MTPVMLIRVLFKKLMRGHSNMRLHLRLRLWVALALGYVLLMGFVHIFHIPLRSRTFHSHYDMSDEGVLEKAHSAVKKMVEKYAKAALEHPGSGAETAEQITLLTKTFKKADKNANEVLELSELSSWIAKKTKEHLTHALRDNVFTFTAIDLNPRNGVVSWEEFHAYFLKQHGYDDEFIKNHEHNHKGLPREIKEAIMRDKAAWSEAARSDPDQLTLDEFLAFRHPESSHATILNIVEETIARLDVDGDGQLTKEEFADPEINEVPDGITPERYKEERLKDFKIADEDKNGSLDRKELLRFIDPRNTHHAEKEALNLMTAADTDQDGVLTLLEILGQRELFMASKMVDAAKSFHDEF